MNNNLKFIISIIIPVAVGAVAGFFTASSVSSWFATIEKPSFNPPNWIFSPVWTLIYILMGLAFYFVWKTDAAKALKNKAIIFYAVQLFLNFLWSFIFFYAHNIFGALVDIVLLWIMIAATIYWFGKINKTAAWLLVPYLCWVSFATALNFAIWQLN